MKITIPFQSKIIFKGETISVELEWSKEKRIWRSGGKIICSKSLKCRKLNLDDLNLSYLFLLTNSDIMKTPVHYYEKHDDLDPCEDLDQDCDFCQSLELSNVTREMAEYDFLKGSVILPQNIVHYDKIHEYYSYLPMFVVNNILSTKIDEIEVTEYYPMDDGFENLGKKRNYHQILTIRLGWNNAQPKIKLADGRKLTTINHYESDMPFHTYQIGRSGELQMYIGVGTAR